MSAHAQDVASLAEGTREAIIRALVVLGCEPYDLDSNDVNLLRQLLAALANADSLVNELDAGTRVVDLTERIAPGGGRSG